MTLSVFINIPCVSCSAVICCSKRTTMVQAVTWVEVRICSQTLTVNSMSLPSVPPLCKWSRSRGHNVCHTVVDYFLSVSQYSFSEDSTYRPYSLCRVCIKVKVPPQPAASQVCPAWKARPWWSRPAPSVTLRQFLGGAQLQPSQSAVGKVPGCGAGERGDGRPQTHAGCWLSTHPAMWTWSYPPGVPAMGGGISRWWSIVIWNWYSSRESYKLLDIKHTSVQCMINNYYPTPNGTHCAQLMNSIEASNDQRPSLLWSIGHLWDIVS